MFKHALMKASGQCEIIVDSHKFDTVIDTVNLCGNEMSFEGRLLAPFYRPAPFMPRMALGRWNTDPEIKKVIFNYPATIVYWSDGSKTVVKCQNNEIFDPEKGLAMAITKKFLGNKGNYCYEFKKWLPENDIKEFELKNGDICKGRIVQ